MEQSMAIPAIVRDRRASTESQPTTNEANSAGVSWPAVFGGAFVTAALSLILLALGTGLGLSSVSPWSNVGASASTISGAAIAWFIVMQILAASMGGYLAGRLRTKWTSVHSDEVYFRDTAHGFLAWAVALVITAAFLTSAAAAMVGAGATSAASAASAASSAPSSSHALDPNQYFVDTLFRADRSAADSASPATVGNLPLSNSPAGAPPVSNASLGHSSDGAARAEAGLIFANALRQGGMPAADQTYLGQVVASQTGLQQPAAEKRVSDVFAQTQQAADAARKAAAHACIWIFVALLIGAFCASLSATFGGSQRDHVVVV
jgi:hypothetical protein